MAKPQGRHHRYQKAVAAIPPHLRSNSLCDQGSLAGLGYCAAETAHARGSPAPPEDEGKLIAHAYRMQGPRGLLIKTLFQTRARMPEFVNITTDEVFFDEPSWGRFAACDEGVRPQDVSLRVLIAY
jgi:hypothetical protein